jgi:hypothetical protein
MELEGQLPCSDESAPAPYHEPAESSPYRQSLFLEDEHLLLE